MIPPFLSARLLLISSLLVSISCLGLPNPSIASSLPIAGQNSTPSPSNATNSILHSRSLQYMTVPNWPPVPIEHSLYDVTRVTKMTAPSATDEIVLLPDTGYLLVISKFDGPPGPFFQPTVQVRFLLNMYDPDGGAYKVQLPVQLVMMQNANREMGYPLLGVRVWVTANEWAAAAVQVAGMRSGFFEIYWGEGLSGIMQVSMWFLSTRWRGG